MAEQNTALIMEKRPLELVVEHVFRDQLPLGKDRHGLMLVYDGEKVLEEAAKKVDRPKTGFGETMSVPDDDSLSKYLRTLGMKDDLVHFLNRFGHEVTPYEGGMRKDFPNIDMEDVLRYSLPKDFPKVGCKTAAGAIVPQAHPELEVIVVRADGTTLLFDRYGLREQISDFDAETSTATYTCYRNKDGKPNWDANKYIVPALKVAIDKYGRDAVGNCVYLDCKLKSRQDEKVHHPQMQTTTLHPDDFEEHHDRYELPPHVVMAIDLAA